MKEEIELIWIDLHEELLRFIRSKVQDEQLSKDLLQEVFIKVQLKIEQLQHTSKLTSWVYQITRNTIYDHYRKKNKSISIGSLDIAEEADSSFEYQRLSDCINGKIAALSPKHKEAILLTAFKNYSQKELADHLGISYSGTKSRVQKAKDLLKDSILDCPNVATDKTGKLLGYEKKDS